MLWNLKHQTETETETETASVQNQYYEVHMLWEFRNPLSIQKGDGTEKTVLANYAAFLFHTWAIYSD